MSDNCVEDTFFARPGVKVAKLIYKIPVGLTLVSTHQTPVCGATFIYQHTPSSTYRNEPLFLRGYQPGGQPYLPNEGIGHYRCRHYTACLQWMPRKEFCLLRDSKRSPGTHK